MQNPGGNTGPENPEQFEAVPKIVGERLELIKDVRNSLGIPGDEVQSPPMSHAEMTKKFWETHDITNPDDVRKLAEFTMRFDVVKVA